MYYPEDEQLLQDIEVALDIIEEQYAEGDVSDAVVNELPGLVLGESDQTYDGFK